MIAPRNIDELYAHVGEEVGASGWQPVTHDDVNRFAAATGDRQWTHTDVARAPDTVRRHDRARVLHGLARTQAAGELVSFEHFGFAMNYGLNRVRFTSPLPVGDQVRMRIRLDSVEPRMGGADLTATLTFERAGGHRPVRVAEFLIRLHV